MNNIEEIVYKMENTVQPISEDYSSDGTLDDFARVDHQHPLSTSLRNAIFGTGKSSRRNLLDNGEFNVSQRYGTTTTGLNPPGSTFYADRWFIDWPNPGSNALYPSYPLAAADNEFWTQLIMQGGVIFAPVAGAVGRLYQTIEGIDVQHLKWGTSKAQPLVFSFYCQSDIARTVIVEFENIAGSRSISRSVNLLATTSLQRYQVTIPGDTSAAPVADTAGRLRAAIWFIAGSTWSGGAVLNTTWGVAASNTRAFGCSNFFAAAGGQLQFTGMQLEIGTVATPYEHRDYRTELEKCMRYFQIYAQPALRGTILPAANSNADRMGMVLPVPMRGIPTASISAALPIYDGFNTGTANAIGASFSTAKVCELNFTTTIVARAALSPLLVYQSGTASLSLSAEI